MKKYWFLKIVKILVLGTLAAFVFSYLLMSLWNWLVPELFHGPVITMAQALGLFVLSKILFSGFGGGGWRHYADRRKMWRHKFENHISKMSPEEKDRLRKKFYGSRCNPFGDERPSDYENINPSPNEQHL